VAEGAGWSGIFGFVAGLLVGFGVLTCTGPIGRCGGWLTTFVFRRPEPEAVVDDAATRDLALKQLAIIRQRNGMTCLARRSGMSGSFSLLAIRQ
ncbi:unnamed protein product, partial [Prorocentrum cordatum]